MRKAGPAVLKPNAACPWPDTTTDGIQYQRAEEAVAAESKMVPESSTPRGLSGPSPPEINPRNAVTTIGPPFKIELLRTTKADVPAKLPLTAPNMFPPI